MPRRQRLGQGLPVHELAPRHVQQDASLLHPSELLAAEDCPSLRRRGVQGDDVGGGQEIGKGQERDSHLPGSLRRQVRVESQDLRLEGAGPGGHARADLPEADDPERFARKLRADELRFLPLALGHRSGRAGNAAQQREEEGERVLHRRDDVGGRRVDDENAALGRRRHVHVVHAHAGAPDDRELRRGLHQLAIHFRRAADEQGLRVLDLREKLLPRRAGEVHDLVPGLPQPLEPALVHLLGDDDAAQGRPLRFTKSDCSASRQKPPVVSFVS